MKPVRLIFTIAAASLLAEPVVVQASPAQVQRGSARVEQGSEVRGVSFVLIALVLAALLAVVLGGKNDPVSP